jgi:hypothetical protein
MAWPMTPGVCHVLRISLGAGAGATSLPPAMAFVILLFPHRLACRVDIRTIQE